MPTHNLPLNRARRPLAGLTSAALVLSGTLVISVLATGTANAAVLGAIDVTPTTGTDATLFGGTVANAQCPDGTGDSYWSVDGPDLPADQAILAPGNATGTGAQSFSGASIANLKSANAGSFSANGTYLVKFNCVRSSDGMVSDTYQRSLSYVSGSGGSYTMAPNTAPGAPTIGTATAGNAQASVTFTAPTNNGGAAITGYTVTSSPGGLTATGAASPLVVTGLTNGTAYTFTVTATNSVGTGAPSAASNSVTPAAAPSTPAAPTATAGDTQASVAFVAPAANGSAITGYTVTSTPGGLTATGAASPLVVTGLSNGTPYTFTVTATNGVGTSAASPASNSVTPAAPTAPGAPTIGTATAGNTQASVTFSAPASNGGAAITGYTVTSSPGGLTAAGAASPLTVTGLTNGTAYTFTVTATNSVGTGPASAASNSVTPIAVPGAPTIGTATAGNTQATVTFTAPADNGGSAITGYTVTSSPGNLTATGAASPLTVTGLTNGTAYTFTVTATNATGTGPASAASNSVTPATVPSTPSAPTATAGNGQASVAFVAPNNGGSAITGYTVTSAPGGFTATGAASPLVVTGLTNGTAYTFTVKATNAKGDSAASAASAAVTPSANTATTTTINPVPPVTPYGYRIRVSGKVHGIVGDAVVTLRIYPAGEEAFDLDFDTTDGKFSFAFAPPTNATYRLLFAGDDTHTGSVSGTVRNLVSQRPLIGGIAVNGTRVTVWGRVAPGEEGLLVTLGEKRGERFVVLARVRTNSVGRFSIPATLTRGAHRLQVRVAATPWNAAGASVQPYVVV